MADYEKMWEDLGMDVKNHDNLCQVLPTAVGDVFMTQENRPKAMDFWDMVIAEVHGIRPAELIEEQKKGRKVFGTFCVYVPDEVIIAANGIVTGLCGGSQFWVPDGEKVLPKNVCPLVKASVGARLGRTCPFFRIADMYRYVYRGNYLRRQEESLRNPWKRRSNAYYGRSTDEA